jgi:outer membrane protein TolC
MRILLFAGLFTGIFCSLSNLCTAQDVNGSSQKMPATSYAAQPRANMSNDYQDSLIKEKLVSLAINNPELNVADANIKIAQYGLDMAKSSWLSMVNVAGNVNEFVIDGTRINGTAASTYYPKYNIGATLPFDIFSKTKGEKHIATQNIVLAKALKEDKIRLIKEEVLVRYEDYKEKKELMRLQKVSSEGDNDAYIAAQKSYADGTIQLAEMNKSYQLYIDSQSKLVSAQRDVNVAAIHLEEMIGEPVDQAIHDAASN